VVESLAAGGDGIAHDPDGRVVFVPLTAPGDRVRARVVEERARFARAELVEVLAPGPARVAPPCPVFGTCGGCTWQHLDYDVQVEAKREILRAALERIGGAALPAQIPFTPSPQAFGYRSRARIVVQNGHVGYRRRRSHALCDTIRCPILLPALEAALPGLARERAGEWELAVGDGDEVRATRAPDAARPGDRAPTRARRGAPVTLRLGPDRLALSPGVFAQSNALLHEALATAVHAAARSGAVALELYAGAGFFTLGLARRFARVIAVESHPGAVADLARNLLSAGLSNVEVRAVRVETVLSAPPGDRPDIVVLDPPRTGLAPGAAEALAALRAPRIAYLSCDPATLARDVRVLCDRGYAIAAVRGFDLFPQTPHVEALVELELRSERAGERVR
jgi:23S rRNA (uracil1939-C5)-methyltransferase